MLLKFAAKEFLEDREFKNLSKYTLNRYRRILNEFQEYCFDMEVLNVEDVVPNIIKGYLLYCQKERGNNPTTKNTKLRCLKTFFNFVEESEIISAKRNPVVKVSYAREEVKIEVFTDYQIKQMLAYFRSLKQRDKSFFAYRGYQLLIYLLGTGSRLGETVNLRWKDIDLINGTATVWGKKREQSSIPLTDKLVKDLMEYKYFCQKHFKNDSEYVFVSQTNEQLTPNAIKCLFKRLSKIMNFSDVRLSCHTFRHTFAHRSLMAGMDIFTLQKMLRHSNIEMTQKYLSIWGTALKEQNEKFNPLNSIDF
ncbi:tyrosine-type recombinase/integrase [Ammoniphilus sp. CFH 90114]|uniref:tyrosine-type recombinase/integrase n=1 Tax=Ammoniphilus sp. CFH 90114 TaxID=2493665 RepID=UPI00100FB564|nr:tyrosine-type recombinase/integrase [Ammoniphilus sp. CFH 90114]RXT14857.1 integrase [Ammoniphilus sp. CFH 90114]